MDTPTPKTQPRQWIEDAGYVHSQDGHFSILPNGGEDNNDTSDGFLLRKNTGKIESPVWSPVNTYMTIDAAKAAADLTS